MIAPQHRAPRTATPRCAPFAGVRRALCVGIDTYARRPLAGARADAVAWSAALQRLGFVRPVLLADRAATRTAILDALEALVTGSQPGDTLVFQYAGHGTLVPDLDGDEAQDATTPTHDEAICPVDFDRGRLIIDDEIGRILDRLPAGAGATCFFDCCHAGSMARGVDPGCPVPRSLTLRPIEVERYRQRDHGRGARAAGAAHARDGDGAPVVTFSACRSDEIAWETQGRGDFTRHALAALDAGGDALTNAGLLAAIQTAFGAAARQTPLLACVPALREARLFAAAG